MAIRSFFGYDDVPLPAGEQLAATVPLLPLPFSGKPGSAAGAGGVTYTKGDGWLKCTGSVAGSGSSVKTNSLSATLAALGCIQGAAAVITIGVRMFFPVGVSNATYWPHPISIVTSGTITPTTVGIGTAFPFGSVPGWVAGKEYYFEAQYDLVANVIRRKIDGVSIADLALSSTTSTAIAAGTAQFSIGAITTGTLLSNIELSFWFKDMYVIEKTADGTADSFLGPQQVLPITVSSLDQPTWAATGAADSVTALNTDITDAASLTAPVVTSDVNNLNCLVGLTLPTVAGQINAVAIDISARRKDGASGVLGTQIVSGADTSPLVNLATTNSMVAGYKAYYAEKSPSGVRWTKSALQAAKLKLIAG
jgi:TM2 domain-containing membrane protein YozV